jgi:hypothetical protein
MRAFFYTQDSGTRGSALSEKLSAKYWQNGGQKNTQATRKIAQASALSFGHYISPCIYYIILLL